MTGDDLTRLRDEVAGVLAEIRARRDGNLQPLSYYHRWADVEADALLPLLAQKIAEAWNAGYCTNRDPSAVKLAHLHNPYMQAPEGEEQ